MSNFQNEEKLILTEQALLGLILKNNKLISEVSALLEQNDFTSPKTTAVFLSILHNSEELLSSKNLNNLKLAEDALNYFNDLIVDKENKNNDLFIKSDAIKWSIKDWHDYLAFLIFSAGFKNQLDNYIQVIRESRRLRQFRNIVFGASNIDSKKTSLSLISSLQDQLLNLSKDIEVKSFVEIDSFADEFYEKLVNQTIDNNNVKTGLKSLDLVINGFNPGDLIILAARPSMGKTAFALELTRQISASRNVAFFSIEMPNEQLLQRLVASNSGIFLNRIKNYNTLTTQQKSGIETSIETIKTLNLWLDDTPGLRLNELVWKARKLNSINNLDLIIIDYLQLIELSDSKSGDNRNQQVSIISRTLKSLARELSVPVISLSQLSRRVETREDKRPIMSDIRESGSVEQDADLIMFLYRDNYYKRKQEHKEGNFQEEIEVIISKHRNGPTGLVKLLFDPTIGTFEDLNE